MTFDPVPAGSTRSLPLTIWAVLAVVALALIALLGVVAWAFATGVTQHGSGPPVAPFPGSTASPTSTAAPTPGGSSSPTDEPGPDEAPGATGALSVLEQIPDWSGGPVGDYFRTQFGDTWYDVDRNGCDTRNDILRRDLTDTTLKPDSNGCKVLTGTLLDPYTGATVGFESGPSTSALVQIDHVVPLAWAWEHGADTWTFEERMEFANDPLNLTATQGDVNQAKGASGPGQWMPPRVEAHCDYAVTWVDIVNKWDLELGRDDRAALQSTLRSC